MAVLSDNGKYVTVQKGDTLSAIAQKYCGAASKYKTLAAINNIENPDLIYVGQKIILSANDVTPKATITSQIVAIKQYGVQSDNVGAMFVTWAWSKHSQTDEYKVCWEYKTAVGVWFVANESSTTYKYSTCEIPENAKQIRVKVQPVSKRYTSNNKQCSYFTGKWSDPSKYVHNVDYIPDIPSNISVSISDDLKLTAKVNNVDEKASIIKFEVVKDNASTYKTGKVSVKTRSATYTTAVVVGGEYKVRCCAYVSGMYSDWSDYVDAGKTRPANPAKPTKCEARSQTSVYLEWAKVSGATKYIIEHAQKKTDFDITDKPIKISDITTTERVVDDLVSGNEYFFRIKAVDDNNRESEWSDVVSVKIGTGPIAPTTWSSTTTAVIGNDEKVSLYWVHNTEDKSSQTYAEVELIVTGVSDLNAIANAATVEIGTITKKTVDTATNKITYRVDNSTDEKVKDKTHSLTLSTTNYTEGAKIVWCVRTAGITNVQGEWSTPRIIDIYTKPGLTMSVTDSKNATINTLTSFPINISAVVTSVNTDMQRPITYHISVIANESYDTVDNIGNPKQVTAGTIIYSAHFNQSATSTEYSLSTALSPGDLSLESGYSYTIACVVSMSSGLTATVSHEIEVSWDDVSYVPNAMISVDTENYSTSILPYCSTTEIKYYKAVYSMDGYMITDEEIEYAWGEPLTDTYTTDGYPVYYGVDGNDNAVYYAIVESETEVTDVYLSVYRREFDGTFTEVFGGLDAAESVTVTDPHPALDYARYRIVATDKTTGAITYYDLPNHPIGGGEVVIQWDEAWVSFGTYSGDDVLGQASWSGSMIKLPYNIDVSDNHNSDVALVEYIGRKHPVSYYGTQLGESSTWQVEIDKKDVETLYALRRLAVWSGDVYVREPSGSGYWANISVSFSQKHRELTIPVTMDIIRVEGGV